MPTHAGNGTAGYAWSSGRGRGRSVTHHRPIRQNTTTHTGRQSPTATSSHHMDASEPIVSGGI